MAFDEDDNAAEMSYDDDARDMAHRDKAARKNLQKKQRSDDLNDELQEYKVEFKQKQTPEEREREERREPAAFYAVVLKQIERAKNGNAQKLNLRGGRRGI